MKGNLSYKKYITTPLGNNGIGKVDENRRLTLEMPLFNSNWNYPVNLTMNYCLDITANSSNLGPHAKLNYAIFDYIYDSINETYTINFPNFISESFKKVNDVIYKSNNSSKYLQINDNKTSLIDENGLKYDFDASGGLLPTAIYNKDTENRLLIFDKVTQTNKTIITSKTNERIELEQDPQTEIITKAKVYRPTEEGNDSCVCTINFEYNIVNNKKYIKKITKSETYGVYSKEGVITFSLENNYFQIHDSVSNSSVRYYYTLISTNYIINSIEEGYYDSNNVYYISNKVNIEKQGNVVTISDYLDNEEKWLLSHERVNAIRKNSIVQSFEYTKEGMMKTASPQLDYNESSGNLILNGGFQNGTANWTITGSSTILSVYDMYFDGNYLKLNGDDIALSQIVNVDGALCNSITLSYYVYDSRSYEDDSNSLSATITLLNDNAIVDTKTFDVSLLQDGQAWCLMSHSITSKKSYNKVKVEFKGSTGTTELRFTEIALFKDIVTSCYEYDENNNTSRIIVGDRKSEYYYLPGDKHNVVYKNLSNMGGIKREFDEDLLPTISKDKYGIIKRTVYDEAKNVVETKIVDYDNKYTSVNYEYNTSSIEGLNRQFLTKAIDENSSVTNYTFDSKSKVVKKISRPNNLDINYLYSFGNVSKIRYSNEETNQNKAVNISSTNDGYPLEYTDPNDKKVTFEYYNGNKNIKYVKPANSKLKEYTYKTYNYNGQTIYTGIFDTIKYPLTNEIYKYNYVNNLLDNIDYITDDTKRIAKLYYDSYDRLNKIESYDYINGALKETKEYAYDVNHRLIKEQINNIIVNYYHEQNRVGYQFPEKEYYQSFTTDIKEVNYHLKEMFDSLKRPSSPFGTIYSLSFMEEEENSLTYYSNNSSISLTVKEALYGKDVFNTCYNLIPCADYYSDTTALGYELNSYNTSTNIGSALMWFKPNLHSNQVLFSLGRSDGDYVKLYINDTYSLVISFGVNGEKIYESRLDELGFFLEGWNFVGFTWHLNASDILRYEFKIALNEQVVSFIDTEAFPYLGSQTYLISIGCIRTTDGAIDLTDKYIGLLTGVMISDTRVLNLSNVADYYQDYYNDFNNSLGSINKYNITNQYDYQELMETNNLDIIAYNNSLVSFKGIKPSSYKKRDIKNKKEVFEYDANLEDLALNLDSGYLAYEFGLGQSGTILMEFKAFLFKEKRILLKNKFGTFDVSIYIKSDRYVYLNFNGTEYNTNLRILHEQWNKISFGYSLAIVSSSLSVYTFLFRIVLNGVEYVTVLEANQYISYTNVKTYIGSDESEEYSLDGLVSKVAFTDKYLNKDNIVSIFTSLVPIKAISKYDDFNRILNKKVLDNYEHYSIMYNYEVNDSKKYTRVSSEFINHARYDYNYSYTYDEVGNLSTITKDGALYRAYEYDYLNRLIKETHYDKNKYISYTYDDNGNIVLKYVNDNTTNSRLETYNYSYDATYKDKLIAYNNQTISYSSTESPLPSTFNNYALTWFGNRLVKMSIPETDYYISFEYNSVGERISKKVYLSGKNYQIKYTYENGKLIREEKINYATNQTSYKYFTYDANEELLSIKIDDVDYYYVKNIFGDILGLARYDEEDLYVSYEYDAWGNATGYGSRSNSDVYITPFIYKGYYYDEETQLYWVSSRYYSPELCRWISPDDVSYLDPSSVNGLNLYCYCFNNPIMFKDSSGNYPEPIGLFGDMISGFSESLGKVMWKHADNYLKNPMTIKQAQKIIRKRGLKKSARALLRDYSDDALNSFKFGKGMEKFGSVLGKTLVVIDIGTTIYGNYKSGSDTWVSESAVDVGYTLIQSFIANACTCCIPGVGWLVGIGISLLLDYIVEETGVIDDLKSFFSQYDDEIREILFGRGILLGR